MTSFMQGSDTVSFTRILRPITTLNANISDLTLGNFSNDEERQRKKRKLSQLLAIAG